MDSLHQSSVRQSTIVDSLHQFGSSSVTIVQSSASSAAADSPDSVNSFAGRNAYSISSELPDSAYAHRHILIQIQSRTTAAPPFFSPRARRRSPQTLVLFFTYIITHQRETLNVNVNLDPLCVVLAASPPLPSVRALRRLHTTASPETHRDGTVYGLALLALPPTPLLFRSSRSGWAPFQPPERSTFFLCPDSFIINRMHTFSYLISKFTTKRHRTDGSRDTQTTDDGHEHTEPKQRDRRYGRTGSHH